MSRVGWCALCLVAVACEGAPTPRQIVGCARLEAEGEGDVCVVPSGETRLLVRPGAPVEAEHTGRQAWIGAAQATGMWRCGDDARTCRVAVRAADPVLEDATALRWRDPEAALARLQSLADDPDPKRRVRARALAARVRGASDPSGAVATLRETSVDAERLGLWTDAMRDAVAAAHLSRTVLFEFAAARAALDSVAALEVREPGMALELRYHRGLLRRDLGDVRGALEALEGVVGAARARGDVRREREALNPLAGLYGALDREDATIWARLAELDGDDPCAEADRSTNRGWIALLAAERGGPFEGRVWLERAASLYASGCADPLRRANAATNLALADWHEGRWEEASARLETVEGGNAVVEVWRAILRARLEPENAIAILDQVPRIDGSMLAWRLAVERGRALETRDVEGALRAYAEAEAMLERELDGVPLDVGREGFVGHRDESVRRLVRLAAREGRTTLALQAARAALSRDARGLRVRDRLATLEGARRARFEAALGEVRRARSEAAAIAESSWRLAVEERAPQEARLAALEARATSALDAAHALFGDAGVDATTGAPVSRGLPPLGEGEIVVATLRDGAKLVVLVGDERAATAHVVDSEREAATAITTQSARLSAARRVRVVADASSRGIDVGAVRLDDGRALAEVTEVVDAVDVPVRAARRSRRALVVANPREDLVAAAREGDAVAEALRERGFEVTRLSGAAATYEAVLRALPEVSYLHYAGHHLAREGLRSALPLANDASLDVRDVLALPAVPERVVLSGCATAEGEPSMARAFVLAGAQEVVGTSRAIDDHEAARFVRAWRERGLDEEGFFATRSASWERGDAEASAFRWIVP